MEGEGHSIYLFLKKKADVSFLNWIVPINNNEGESEEQMWNKSFIHFCSRGANINKLPDKGIWQGLLGGLALKRWLDFPE